ncbi:hypothetical protein PV392_09570 [Streptomyces sp. ME03-5709C]|nr:hypothetical protein [Streptomyces sp. ME03-5709C]
MRRLAAVQRISPHRGLLLLAMLLMVGLHLLGCAHGPDYGSSDAITSVPTAAATCRPSGQEHDTPDLAGMGGPREAHHALCEVGLNRVPDPRPHLGQAATAALLAVAAEGSAPGVPKRRGRGSAACALPAWRPDTLTLLCVSRT